MEMAIIPTGYKKVDAFVHATSLCTVKRHLETLPEITVGLEN